MSLLGERSQQYTAQTEVVRLRERIGHPLPGSGDFQAETTFSLGEIADEKPALTIVNSFGSGREALRQMAKMLAQDGHETGSHERKRIVRTYDDPRVAAARQDALGYRMLTLGSVVEAYNAPQTLVGWSTGGAVALRYALAQPGEQHNIHAVMLTGSVGLVGPDKPGWLAWRATREFARAVADPRALKMGHAALEVCRYVSDNPALCIQEVHELATTDISNEIIALRERGIPVGITAFTRDEIFPLKRVREQVKRAGIDVSNYYEVDASHVELAGNEKVVKQVHDAVLDLESARP